MDLEYRANHAAKTILTQCLALPAGAELAIFADEYSLDIAATFSEVAVNLDLHPLLFYYSAQMQENLGDGKLPPAVESLLDDVVASLICLNSTSTCLPFRDNLRKKSLNAGCKVAHMPGIDWDTLLLADVDYKSLTTMCELLALALAKGHQIKIVTLDHKGAEHILRVPLSPWRRLPIISDGVIQRGSWGNVPSGETYIAPPEGLAEGSIVIDGSIPAYCMADGEEIILKFAEGKLVDYGDENDPAVRHLLATQIALAQADGDENWSNLAEIGFGTNSLVKTLTGIPLFDEKKYGTIHVALGDSMDMGGRILSRIHCDMISKSPLITIDKKEITANGQIVIKDTDWCEDFRDLEPPKSWSAKQLIKCTATDAEEDGKGRLRRLWDTSSGRVCSVPVGNPETAKLASTVYRMIEQRGNPVMISTLSQQQEQFTAGEIIRLTYLLYEYGLVKNNLGGD